MVLYFSDQPVGLVLPSSLSAFPAGLVLPLSSSDFPEELIVPLLELGAPLILGLGAILLATPAHLFAASLALLVLGLSAVLLAAPARLLAASLALLDPFHLVLESSIRLTFQEKQSIQIFEHKTRLFPRLFPLSYVCCINLKIHSPFVCLFAWQPVSLAHLDRFLQVDALMIWIESRLLGADAFLV